MEELKGIEQLVSHMLGIRESRLAEWRELSRWIAGNRGIFEKRLNDKWDDLTLFRGVATQALQRGASGMTSSMTPRNISWFRAEFRDRQLDALERAMLDGLDKLLTPPMWANAGVKEELDLSSGAINYTGPGSEIRPILDLSPYVQALPGIMQEIATVSARLDQTLLASIFSSLPLDQRPRDMSATEFLERKREVLQQVGPVISAYEPEVLTPLLWRTARSLERMGLSQPAPDSLRDIPLYLQMRFISPMANALRATDAEAVRALLTDTLQICQANPEVLDKVDLDQCIDELASGLGAPGSVIRADSDVAALRQQRMEQMQAMQEQQRQQEQTNA